MSEQKTVKHDAGKPGSGKPGDGVVEPSWDILTGNTENDRRNVSILFESVADLYGPQTVHELMRRSVDRAIQVTGAERGMLFLEQKGDAGGIEPVVVRGAGQRALEGEQRYSATVVNKVWKSGEPSLTIDTADEQPASLSASIMSLRLLSVMGVPLPVHGRNLGVLYVDSTAKVKEFTQSDYSVFQALGGLIAMAVENARLMAAKAEQDRIKRELAVAQHIQQQLLPSNLPTPEGLQFAAIGRPCEETSGDYYDVVPVSGDRLALVVGDVSGHGLGPALLMASTRALLHSFLYVDPAPDTVIGHVNRFLERDTPDNSFMSLFLAVLSPATRSLQYVSAGHNPPLLLRASGEVVELGRTGPVLGVLEPAPFGLSEDVTLHDDDVLMLYTDGLFEAQRHDGEMYGEERLQASLIQHAQGSGPATAQDILDGVVGDLDAFVGATPLDDDVTCLVVRATRTTKP